MTVGRETRREASAGFRRGPDKTVQPAKAGPKRGRNHQAQAPAYPSSQQGSPVRSRRQLSRSTYCNQLVEQLQPVILLGRMEVVGLKPPWIGLAESAGSKIIQRAEATGVLKYEIDHFR